MALPSNVDYGTVEGQFLLAYADSNDVDLFPDGQPAKGSIFFTPSPSKLLNASSTPNPVTIVPQTVEVQLDNDGYIEGYSGERGVRLVATDDADLNPLNWTWSVEFRLTDQQDVPVPIAGFSFSLPAGDTIDLTTLTPVPDANGTYYLVGPTGPANELTVGTVTTLTPEQNATVDITGTAPSQTINFGIPQGEAATVAAGTTTTGSEGTNASVTNSGTTADAVFDFTIPRGDTGATGPQGDAATVTVGTVTTVNPADPATVTNVGTTADAIFDFDIPKGDTGDAGNITATAPITYDSVNEVIGFDDTQITQIDGGNA